MMKMRKEGLRLEERKHFFKRCEGVGVFVSPGVLG
jgi:hypothetical protein